MMLTEVSQWLQGTCWSVLIYVWRGIFESYMSPLVVQKLGWRMSPSMEFYISMFSYKPPCIPLFFGTAVIILSKAAGAFSYFLASTTSVFSSFLAFTTRVFSSAFSSCLAFFFHFLFFLRIFLQLFLLS